jgi:flagellar capping protein FliD
MPTTLPESVRESWGASAADDFARWLDEYVQDHAVPRDEYREVLSRLDVLENEVAGINERLDRMEERFEGRFDHMEERFEGRLDQVEERSEGRFDQMEERFEGRFDQMEGRFNQMEERFNQMDQRIDRMHEQMRVMMRWTVGTIALFGTIVTVLLAIAEFAP